VTIGGTAIPNLTSGGDQASAAALAASAVNAFYVSSTLQTVFIKVFDSAAVLVAQATF
jgi:hypothetical protein